MLSRLVKTKLFWFVAVLFTLVFLWWVKILLSGNTQKPENYWFNLGYGLIALTGGVSGLIISSKKWDGSKSVIGRGLIFLSLGLIGEWFGNLVWGYYNLILKVDVPYPSLADIGYFSLIPFYTLAMINFAKASGSKFALGHLWGKLQVVIIPLVVLGLSYALFLKDVGFDPHNLTKTLLDFGYPAGEALSVSLGLLTYTLSRNLLGGKMKSRIVSIILALTFQYLTEFTFLYTSGKGIYYNASFVDLMYAGAYLLMTLGLLSFNDLGGP